MVSYLNEVDSLSVRQYWYHTCMRLTVGLQDSTGIILE